MKKIEGTESIRRILLNKFKVDYYQREYKWGEKQLQDLIYDITGMFLQKYQQNADRLDIKNYENYFMGSIIISEHEDNYTYIIDGQQRLITIILILIYLKNHINNEKQKSKISDLIYSDKYGATSFTIDINEETNSCMKNLLDNNQSIDMEGLTGSVQNIMARYNEIEKFIPPEDFNQNSLLFFSDWLIENVYLMKIVTNSDEDAYTIFETMNDRGLSLNSLEMLKGYLLTSIEDENLRKEATGIWNSCSENLYKIGEVLDVKDENTEAFKAWLRSQYAQTIREHKSGAGPGDFDRIGTELHRWLKDKDREINLLNSSNFYDFIKKNEILY